MTALAETNAVPASEPAADDAPGLSKVDRLRIGGYAAPKLRRDKSKRRIAVVDKDGNVVGYRDLADVQKKILERAKIEFDVADGVRPKTVLCELCNAVVKVPKAGPVLKRCVGGICPVPCAGGCGKMPPKGTFVPSVVKRRAGQPWRCRDCVTQERVAAKDARVATSPCGGGCGRLPNPQNLVPGKVKRRNGRPWKCRQCDCADKLKANAAKTPAQRSENVRKAWAARRAAKQAVNPAESAETNSPVDHPEVQP